MPGLLMHLIPLVLFKTRLCYRKNAMENHLLAVPGH